MGSSLLGRFIMFRESFYRATWGGVSRSLSRLAWIFMLFVRLFLWTFQATSWNPSQSYFSSTCFLWFSLSEIFTIFSLLRISLSKNTLPLENDCRLGDENVLMSKSLELFLRGLVPCLWRVCGTSPQLNLKGLSRADCENWSSF